MSNDETPTPATTATSEARRQIEICNACRYCEGYCSVFPAMTRQRAFADGDITQLANLCHNCRGCYYACQYTEPHEFALNLPRVLAEVRTQSWDRYAWPGIFAQIFQKSGVALGATLIGGVALIFVALQALQPDGGPETGGGFYASLSHGAMVAIFTPAFLFPLLALSVGLRRYWRETGGGAVGIRHFAAALADAARLKNLSGGQGQGCNFENGDRYTNHRRYAHQATMWGFVLCFASTSSATLLHYAFDSAAPYGFFSLPKLLGIPGGVLLTLGAAALAWQKTKADPNLGAPGLWGGEMAFVLILAASGATGLALYAATGTALVGPLLAIHLGTVLAFFLTTPYSKMAHGFYRLAALVRDAKETRR